ncbi:YobI family P-loop NTPase [Pseudomonas sp. CBC3]|uniref:YobI family P-loop NTPase n=1 Tax=Pseudomonas sp. CBC3 TaxID=3123318 RepID=UPI0030E9B6F7
MFRRITRGASRCWWALVAGGRAARRSFKAWRSDDDRFFEPLTPVLVEDERAARYERELLRALQNDEVLNIAITGGYGAGKSSVLKTFFEHHRSFKHTFVSLATFTKANAPSPVAQKSSNESAESVEPGTSASVAANSDGAASTDLINRIEETIVQQLLYAVQAKQLPKTRLKRISHASTLRVGWRTLCVAGIGICALRLGAPKLQTLSDVAKDFALKGLMWVPEPVALGVVLAGGVWILYSGLKLLSLFSIDGLTLRGGKLEAIHHASVLHKNIDEIIYCFERSDINVVVIEDLDRFDIQEIFFRLREINFIIRQSPQVKRPIHFIYALRDEMFTVTDKTKFFDLIIPIIPVVNSENSREKLIELLGQRYVGGEPLHAGLTPKLIETVGYHIDEMRLIKNIVNEFDIYAHNLANDGLVLDPNKLFAMVALRNLHPEAYSDLLKRRGLIYQVIEGYPAWVKSEVQRHQLAISALKSRRATRESEVATDLTSLRACVWFELIRRGDIRGANVLWLEDQTVVSLLEFVEDEVFNRVASERNVYPVQMTGRAYGHQKGTAQQPKTLLQELSYPQRVAGLEVSIDDIDDEIIDLQRKIAKLKTMPFREACNDGYGDSFTPEPKGYELITFLLHRGHLDTDYTDYLGYFYEGSLSQSDKKLTMALARGEMLDVGTPIRNPERVASKLDLDSVDKGKGLLMHLMAELVRPRQDDVEAREEKLSVILKSSHHHMGRLSGAVELLPEEDRSAVIKALFRNDSNLINQLLSYDKANLAREDLVVMVLDSLSADQVEQLQGRRGTLLKVINDLREVSKLVPGLASGQMGWAWLKNKPAQFCNASDATTAEDLKALVEWGCISPTMPMLRLLCSALEPHTEVGTVSHHRLGRLGLVGFDGLVEKSPSKYVGELLGQMGFLDETEGSLLAVLALLEDEDDLRLEMFERTTCMLTELDKLPSALWLPALQSERLSKPGDAAWTFFDGVVITPNSNSKSSNEPELADLGDTAVPIFVEFLTRNAATLANELWGVEGEEELQTFIIQNEQVSGDTLKTLFSSIVLAPSVLVNGTVPATRWAFFSNASFVPFSKEIKELISQYESSAEFRYIAHHWREARNSLNLSALPIGLVVSLTRSGVASLADTMTIWQGITAEMYSTWEGAVEELANVCARANKEQATFPSSYLPVITHCLSDPALSSQKRTEMIIQALQMNCSWADVARVLPLLGEEHGALVWKRRAHLPTSNDDRRLVDALKRREFVGAVRFESKRTVVFSKRNQMA